MRNKKPQAPAQFTQFEYIHQHSFGARSQVSNHVNCYKGLEDRMYMQVSSVLLKIMQREFRRSILVRVGMRYLLTD